MNLRFNGNCTFPPDSGCLPNLSAVAAAPANRPGSPVFVSSRIFLSGWNCVSSSPQGHHLQRTMCPFQLWIQVQNSGKSVDITRVGAEIVRSAAHSVHSAHLCTKSPPHPSSAQRRILGHPFVIQRSVQPDSASAPRLCLHRPCGFQQATGGACTATSP